MAAKKSPFDLNQFLATRTETVNRALDKFLPSEKTKPATIHKAMRYSLFAGGKRMRPAVLLAAAAAGDGQRRFPPRQADQPQSLRRRHRRAGRRRAVDAGV
jgi:geranylgeranyl pyrophosphate synthase